jgi:hypothetical protein
MTIVCVPRSWISIARRVRLFELPAKLVNSGDGRVSEPYGVDQAGAAKRGAA